MTKIKTILSTQRNITNRRFREWAVRFASMGWRLVYKNNRQRNAILKMKYIDPQTIKIQTQNKRITMAEASELYASKSFKTRKANLEYYKVYQTVPKRVIAVDKEIRYYSYDGFDNKVYDETPLESSPIIITVDDIYDKKEMQKEIEKKLNAYVHEYDTGSSSIPELVDPEHKSKKSLKKMSKFQINIDDKNKSIKNTKMRGVKICYYLLGENKWDSKKDQCVIDYIMYKYAGKRGFKKLTNESLINEFGESAVTPLELANWCDKHNLGHYVLDESNNVVKDLTRKNNNKYCPALVYKCAFNHIYPIEDDKLRQRVFKANSLFNDIKPNWDNIVVYDLPAEDLFNWIDREELSDSTIILKKINYETLDRKFYNLDFMMQYLIEDRKMHPDSIRFDSNGHVRSFSYKNNIVHYDMFYDKVNSVIKAIHDSDEFTKQEKEQFVYKDTSLSSIMNKIMSIKFGELPKSTFSPEQTDFMNFNQLGPWVESFNCQMLVEPMKNVKQSGIDRKSSYTDIIYNKKSDWMLFDEYCNIHKWEGSIDQKNYKKTKRLTLGFYIVKSPNLRLKRMKIGSRKWGSEALQFLLDNKLVHQSQITHYMKPRSYIKSDYFRKVIDMVYKLPFKQDEEHELRKILVNTFNGTFAKTKSKSTRGFFTTNEDIAKAFYLDNFNNDVRCANLGDIYRCCQFTERDVAHNRAFFDEVIQLSIIELYKMWCYLDSKLLNNVVGCRNDCLYFETNDIDNFNKLNEELSKASKMGDYRIDHFNPVKQERRTELLEHNFYYVQKEWNNTTGYSSDEKLQNEITSLINNGKSFRIQGCAGVGKSYLLKNIIMKHTPKNTVVTALSDKACINLNDKSVKNIAKTLAKHEKESEIAFLTRLKKIQCVVIDEWSMLPIRIMSILMKMKRNGTQIILIGDLNQISPPDKVQINYAINQGVKYLCDYNLINLEYNPDPNIPKRYDQKTYEFLEHFKNTGEFLYPLPIVNKYSNNINICWLNKTRNKINLALLDNIKNVHQRSALLNDFKLKNGMRLIADVKTARYSRKQYFIVVSSTNDKITLKDEFSDNTLIIKKEELKNFEYGYAITADCSQCSTIDDNYVIADAELMSRQRLYTALSRCKNIDQVSIYQSAPSNVAEQKYNEYPYAFCFT